MYVSANEWFSELGSAVDVTKDDTGIYWARLTSKSNIEFVIERYGRGTTAPEAAESARHRWQVELESNMCVDALSNP